MIIKEAITKNDLQRKIEELEEQNNQLENDVEYWKVECEEASNKLDAYNSFDLDNISIDYLYSILRDIEDINNNNELLRDIAYKNTFKQDIPNLINKVISIVGKLQKE